MKLSNPTNVGYRERGNRPGTGADCGGGRAERQRQDIAGGMRAGGAGAG